MRRSLCHIAAIFLWVVGSCASAAIIEPGDAIFTNSEREWFRYRLSTDELVGLDWESPSVFAIRTAFDTDGHLLIPFRTSSFKINPATGRSSPSFPLRNAYNLAVLPNGDYLASASLGPVRRFNREPIEVLWRTSDQTSDRVYDLAISRDSAYATSDEGIWEINLSTGAAELVVESFEFSPTTIPQWIEVRPDGKLLIADRQARSFVYQYDPATDELSELVTPDVFDLRVWEIAVDPSDRLWVGSSAGLYLFDSNGRNPTLIEKAGTGSIARLSIVPADWTPPVPEPASLALLLLGVAMHCGRRS